MEKRKIDIIGIISVVVIIIIFSFVFIRKDISTYYHLLQKKELVEKDIEKKRHEIVAKKTGVHSGETEDIKERLLILPRKKIVPFFLNYLSFLSVKHNLSITSINPGNIVEDGLFIRARFDTEVAGQFFHLYNFLYDLENEWKGIRIETITIDSIDDNKVNAKLTLLVFSVKRPEERV